MNVIYIVYYNAVFNKSSKNYFSTSLHFFSIRDTTDLELTKLSVHNFVCKIVFTDGVFAPYHRIR